MNRPRKRPRKPMIKSASPSTLKHKKSKKTVPKKNRYIIPPLMNPASPMSVPTQPLPNRNVMVPVNEIPAAEVDTPQVRSYMEESGMYDVFRFPVIDWDFRWQRPQQISQQFAQHGHRVFYITTGVTALQKDATYEEVAQHVKIKRIEPNIWLVTLCAHQRLNLYRDQMSQADIQYLSWSVDYVRDRFQVHHLVSIVDLPFWTPLVTAMENHNLLYDCMDEHNGFSTNEKAVIRQEEHLARKANLVLASSQLLYERMQALHSSTLLLRNAADVAHFSSQAIPAPELDSIQGPVIGYYGAISDWFDIRLVEKLAAKRPEWTFILIGHTFGCDTSTVEKLPNVLLLGEKPYTELPSYLQQFDVAIIPFLQNELTRATNPVKLYEYLSAGKPVVSTYLPELEVVADGLTTIARTPEAFEDAIECSLMENDPQQMELRQQYAQTHTWEMRYQELHQTIQRQLFPKVSIVILTHNNWAYTRQCLFSLQKPNRYPNLEIIIIDNGSTDETPHHLSELDPDLFRVIYASSNLGFAAGNSLGCRKATGDYIILLNNDTIIPDESWIQRLIAPLEKNLDIGMSGPMSNHVGNDQAVDHFVGNPVDGAHPQWLHDFYQYYKGSYRYTELLGFFCVAMKRSVFEKIGGLDSKYGIGMFEDDDYCERVKRAGYKLLIVEDAFVYHHGSATIKKLKPDEYDTLWQRNKAYYEQKWSKTWQLPKRPENLFFGAETNEEVAGRLKKNNQKCILVLGGREWSRRSIRWQQLVKQLAASTEWVVIIHLTKYYHHDIVGIRKAGPQMYMTNRLDLFSLVPFEYILYCGENEAVPDFHTHHQVIDSLSYHAHQLEDLRMSLKDYRIFDERQAHLLVHQLLVPNQSLTMEGTHS
ncbi:glycosyltransferase [Paenibacillus dokdonensis]|uniref:Glycosyltransferase n=2 Tax=Paenibacillus dokdonensis TaxID=2567944 RepID=A0ABU6GLV8_9BACL|nr:glycosyltransferase [Paenibacillus dokdonensis]MEC0239710.1 glycosyltransferase [Paenibacillus dokdonensis]